MPDIDLAFTSLSEAADRLDRREVSSVELTEVALERISQVDPNLNAFITILSDKAIASAREADAKRESGERGSLLGVPLALKDLFNTAGIRTTGGARMLADNVPEEDATVVRKLREAGAVILGKTNMMEFAYGYPHPDFGETRNPWALERTAGGSSGGSAAASLRRAGLRRARQRYRRLDPQPGRILRPWRASSRATDASAATVCCLSPGRSTTSAR